MKLMKTILSSLLVMSLALAATPVLAGDVTNSTPGISGYDPVAYFTDGKPMRGSGYHVVEHKGVTYAFATKEHKEMFEADPGSMCRPTVDIVPMVWRSGRNSCPILKRGRSFRGDCI